MTSTRASSSAESLRIGVISDTHGFLDPKVLSLFAGVHHILHAGDIGQPALILALEALAPVTAVIGNTDHGLSFRESEIVVLGGRRFFLQHIVDPRRLSEVVAARVESAQPDVVIFGHTHRRFSEQFDDRLYLNPGYAGKPRFGEPRSVALLEVSAGNLAVEFLDLG